MKEGHQTTMDIQNYDGRQLVKMYVNGRIYGNVAMMAYSSEVHPSYMVNAQNLNWRTTCLCIIC
jgi:hypothetical protein